MCLIKHTFIYVILNKKGLTIITILDIIFMFAKKYSKVLLIILNNGKEFKNMLKMLVKYMAFINYFIILIVY